MPLCREIDDNSRLCYRIEYVKHSKLTSELRTEKPSLYKRARTVTAASLVHQVGWLTPCYYHIKNVLVNIIICSAIVFHLHYFYEWYGTYGNCLLGTTQSICTSDFVNGRCLWIWVTAFLSKEWKLLIHLG